MPHKINKFRKLIILLILLFIIGGFAICAETGLAAKPDLGFEYGTALTLGTRDIRSTIMQVINIFLGFLGVVAVSVILYGGFIYMTAAGSPDKTEKGKKILINGAIGLAIILTSYAIAFFIIHALTNATGGGGCDNDGICEVGENCSNCPSDCGVCLPAPSGGGNFAVSWVDPAEDEIDVALCRLVQIKFNQTLNSDTIDNVGSWGGNFMIDNTITESDVNLWVKINGKAAAGSDCAANVDCASGVCETGTCQGDLVPGEITIWQDERGVTFSNNNDFEINTTYQVVIKSDKLAANGLENLNGDRLALGDKVWTFTTGAETDAVPPTVVKVWPIDNETDVCLQSPIEAVFSEPMDVSSMLSADSDNPMKPDSINSVYINPAISGFNKSANSSDTLIANPKDLFAEFTAYTPTLDSDVIRDSCGNYLDGDADGSAEGSSGGDDYAPDPTDWDFTTGNTAECVPKIDAITPAAGYYNDESIDNVDEFSIVGNYFTSAGAVIFNNDVEVYNSANYCINPGSNNNYLPNRQCIISWDNHQIDLKAPAKEGLSNGAISGDVKIAVGELVSNNESFEVLSPYMDYIAPEDGGIDQFITLTGINFDPNYDNQGADDHIYFINVDDPTKIVEANYPCDGDIGWTDDQIIISVPDDRLFIDGEQWYLQIALEEGSSNYWSNLTIFTFKDMEPGPGLCSITPNTGTLNDAIQLSGVRFFGADQEVNFGNYDDFVSAKNIRNWSYGPPDTVDVDVPNIYPTTVGVYLKIDDKNSNTLNFLVISSDNGPHIDYFDPTSGAIEEYITIYGSKFGDWDGGVVNGGDSNVQFSDGAGGWVDGDFDFANVCGDNFWTDSQIIVKVPAGAGTGNIKVITGDSLSDNTDDLEPADFVVTAGSAGPGICNINPKSGPLGIDVDIFGERLDKANDVKFSFNKSAGGFNIINNETIEDAIVPGAATEDDTSDDAVSGPINVIADRESNGYNFQVFDCREAADGCASIGFENYDCCYTGACMPTGECNNPTKSAYHWDFSGGAYATCGGYSQNQCLAAANCPNSPGRCSPKAAQFGVDTGANCGNDYCNNAFAQCQFTPECEYDKNKNVCELKGIECDLTAVKTMAGEDKTLNCEEYTWRNYPRVAYWRFDEGIESTIYDSSGNGNDGLIYNNNGNIVRADSGRFGRALQFDGIDDYVDVGTDESFDIMLNSDFSIEAWIKYSGAGPIIWRGDGISGEENQFVGLYIENDEIYFDIRDGDGETVSINSKLIDKKNWHHIIAGRDKNGGLKLYINGLLEASSNNNVGNINFSDAESRPLGIGISQLGSSSGNAYYKGYIDEISIYGRFLDDDEVMARYISGDKDYVWQYPLGGGCLDGSFEDINDNCTIGSVTAPILCGGCQNGFSCDISDNGSGICFLDKTLCPDGSICDTANIEADGYNGCKEDIEGECECCCRVDYSETDCCAGLTCENMDCGTDDATYEYGYCVGCAVWGNSNFFQTLSDEMCGCTNGNRVCIVDEINTPPEDIGYCGDCETINSIDFDSDGDGSFDSTVDTQHECQSHGACCWDSDAASCYTCDALQIIDKPCPPANPSLPAPYKDKEDVCINSAVYAEFNLKLDPATLGTGFTVYECNNDDNFNSNSCASVVEPATGYPQLVGSNDGILFLPDADFNLTTEQDFNPDTWYQIVIDSDLKSANGLKLDNDYKWHFKTKDELCNIESIKVIPENAVLTAVFTDQNYKSMPLADCGVLSSDYVWTWNSSNASIAVVTKSKTDSEIATSQNKDGSTQIGASILANENPDVGYDINGETTLYVRLENPKVIDYWPDCDNVCLNAAIGSEFNMPIDVDTLTTANIAFDKWICGNGELEVGEDCDDGNTESGDGCSGIPKSDAAVCNSLTTEEECDDGNIDCFWRDASCEDYNVAANRTECQDANGYWNAADSICVNNKGCLNEGSDDIKAICGNGVVENGEDCDDNPFSQGCDPSACLHTGSVTGLSVCGDNVIGEGEDCDDGNVSSGDGCDGNCLNEGADEFIATALGGISANVNGAGNTVVDINLPTGIYFDSQTYYRIFLNDEIKSDDSGKQLTGLNYDTDHNGENDSFSWSFKTKDEFCNPDAVRIDPSQKTIYNINITQNYQAAPYGAPDTCSSDGQKLNPYVYNWDWNSTNENVAVITEDNNWPVCGNSRVETGEDCDDGNSDSDDGCSNLCLNEGTTRDMGLVTYWDFEEGSGADVFDISGNNNHGALISGEWGTGKYGGAIEFDGISDYIEVGDSDSLDISAAWTIAAWIKPDDITTIRQQIIAKYAAGDQSYQLLLLGDKLNGYYDDGINERNMGISTKSVNAGEWTHIAVTSDGANVYCYINGAREDAVAVSSIHVGASPLLIGRHNEPPYYYFGGSIDDIRIYSTALTGAQIQGIMNQKDYLCGNGVIDFGEDCDGNPFPQGCDINRCLHTGSAVGLATCGDGVLGSGEDCDDGNTTNGDGCDINCLNEGSKTDSYIDFYQTAAAKSQGTTDIEAIVNYCGDEPTTTCGGALPSCATGICEQTAGSSELEIVCGFDNDNACSQGVCSDGFCTNNSNVACAAASENVDCDLSTSADATCNFEADNHTCPIAVWGGSCSNTGEICYSTDDCPSGNVCDPRTDCNYCNNNSSFECRTAHDSGSGLGNSDCVIGVGYDSCCYSRPIVESKFPDPEYYDSNTNPLALDCDNNTTPLDGGDDYCAAFGADEAVCQTYICEDTDSDGLGDTCSAYGKCSDGIGDYEGYCLSDNDCPQDVYPVCDKSCSNDNAECNNITCGACRNAQINITFDKLMDNDSFTDDGVCSNNSRKICEQSDDCGSGICLTNIRLNVKYDNAAVNQKNCPTGFYIDSNLTNQRTKGLFAGILIKFKEWINRLLGRKETIAAEYWCAIPGTVSSFDSNNRTTAVFTPRGLPNNLFESGLTYRVTVKHNVKRFEGVSMGVDDVDDFQYEFTVGDTECQVENVDIYVSE